MARLRFVARARHLELPVDDLRDLVALWEDDDCASVATRMRSTVTERLQDTQRRIAELTASAEAAPVIAAVFGPPGVVS